MVPAVPIGELVAGRMRKDMRERLRRADSLLGLAMSSTEQNTKAYQNLGALKG